MAPPANAQPYLIFRMAVVDHVRRRIVGRAGIVQSGADADEAPSLIEPQVGDDVRHPEAEVSVIDRQAVVVDDRAVRTEERRGGHVDRAAALAGCGVFQRERAGEAVAELGGIGPEVLAGRAGVTRDPHVVVAVGAAVGEEVEERLRPAHREARKLDERAIPERVEGRAAAGGRRRGVLRAEADVGAQRAVFGLLAHVPRDRSADAVVDVVGQVAGEPALWRHLRSVAGQDAACAGIVFGLDAQIPAHLQAGVGAGNVVEPIPVQAADFHVLNRRCLYRHVGCLRPSDRDETRGGTEQKTFHHLHLNLHLLSWEDRSPSGAAHPGRSP